MKNLKLLTVFTLLVLGSISLSAQDFGVVSIEEIFRDLPAKKSADATLEALVEQHQTKIQEKQQALQAIETEVQTKTEGKSQAEIQAMMGELEAMQQQYLSLQQDLINYQQAAAKEVNEREEALYAPIDQTVKNSVDKVAAAKGLKYVMEKSMLIYSNGLDITAEVKKDLGIQ